MYNSLEFKKELQQLIDEIYNINCVGGCLHIVLDDDNLNNDCINWCINNSIKQEKDDYILKLLCQRCAELLLQIPESIREEYLEQLEVEDEK